MENTPQQGLEQPLETPKTAKYSPSQIAIFLLGIIFLLVLAGAAFTAFNSSSNNQNGNNTPQADTTKPVNLAPYSLIYGVWTTDNSLIKSFDLQSGKTYDLASLPTNIKKVTVLDNNRLLYIADTDTQDHGKEIDIYNVKNKTSTPIVKTADGFGIDDYVISPNKQYLALWEIAVDPSTNAFLNGKSRVYTTNLSNPTNSHMIYDEIASVPVHYPRGILDNGTVYTDTFLPNSGTGWAYGMSISNFDGSQKQDLADMTKGTYGTKPELSPDGKYFVFAGYDGTRKTNAGASEDLRQAIITPNTIELLDTSTNQRIKLSNLSNKNVYSDISWSSNDTFLFRQVPPLLQNMTYYSYNINTHTTTQVPQSISADSNTVHTPFFTSQDVSLYADQIVSISSTGNLGNTYAPLITNIQAIENASKQSTALPIGTNPIQYISMEPSEYFSQSTLADNISDQSNNQLQLQTFPLKPSLEPVRVYQQNQRITKQNTIPNESTNTTTPTPKSSSPQKSTEVTTSSGNKIPPGYNDCNTAVMDTCMSQSGKDDYDQLSDLQRNNVNHCYSEGNKANSCGGSPLYLYGPSGTQVSVKILTPISGSSPSYNNKTGYSVILGNNGIMRINGNPFTRISYNYIPALQRIVPPSYGSFSSRNNLSQILRDYAQKFGLNQKETDDLIAESLPQITSPYVFVSFFDQETSKSILPISFSKKPDNYYNIVFYFKQLESKPNYSIQPPVFEKIQRQGFTAVEISEIVD